MVLEKLVFTERMRYWILLSEKHDRGGGTDHLLGDRDRLLMVWPNLGSCMYEKLMASIFSSSYIIIITGAHVFLLDHPLGSVYGRRVYSISS
jgi:hypothetical protein